LPNRSCKRTRRAQPLIRYEVSDRLSHALVGGPSRSSPRSGGAAKNGGRSLGGAAPSKSLALALSATLEQIAGLQEFALHWDGSTLRVTVVPASRPSRRGEVEARLRSTLAAMGADRTEILVSLAEHTARSAERMGKVKMIEAALPPEP
jgi:hypothetical protein